MSKLGPTGIDFVTENERPSNQFGISRPEFHSVNVGLQTVILGDSLTRMQEFADGSIDLVVTSPPYNLGIQYGTFDDGQPRTHYLAWFAKIVIELDRILSHGGSVFLNVGSSSSDPWVSFDIATLFRHRFQLQNNIQWVKSISIGDDTVGHFKPINSKRFLNHNHETIYHFTKCGNVPLDRLAVGVPFKDKSNVGRWKHAADRRCAGNTWFVPYQTVQSKHQKFNHPAGFPVELPERCLKLHGDPNARILDPFLGSGTTLVAAQRLGMTGFGIEIDATYVEVAIERLVAEIAV